MQPRIIRLLTSIFLTVFILAVLEIATSAVLPAMGWQENRLAFNVLIILFMAIKLNSPLLPWFVFILQMIHSVFSIEGWALGTIAGIIISLFASYIKEILQFTSAIVTMVIVQIFQVLWYLLVLSIICLKLGSFEKFGLMLGNAIPGTFVLSIISPLLFSILDRVWSVENEVGRTGVEL